MGKTLHIITVSGLPGSGTSTTCRLLSKRLGWRYVNAGDIFRQLARESGSSLAEFGRRAEADDDIDTDLDARMMEVAQQHCGVILEGRLTGWMAHRHKLSALKVWLQASTQVRATRVSKRDNQSLKQTVQDMVERERSEHKRYVEHHGIDVGDLSVYDLVTDTESVSPAKVAEQIIACLQAQWEME